jgi:hypothetical protein
LESSKIKPKLGLETAGIVTCDVHGSTGTASDAESSSHALQGWDWSLREIARFLVGLGWTRKSRNIGKEDGLSFDLEFYSKYSCT